MKVQETLQILLDHGSEFINTDYKRPFHEFLLNLLNSRKWTVESIRLLIRRGADPGLSVQPWDGCLPLAIYGSDMESPEGVRDALILLITNGADVYAGNGFGPSATEVANDPGTMWWHDSWFHLNSDLRLKDIWTEALAACGYDAEEVNYRNLQELELSDSDDDMDGDNDDYDSEDEDEDEDQYDISEAEDEDNVITDQNDEPREQTEPAAQSHFDWSLLEDYMNVWRT